MKVVVRSAGTASFEATSATGGKFRLEGPADLGGGSEGVRPMEAVLAALGGCSGIDVVKILKQQKEPLSSVEIAVEGTRADAIPAVFTKIHVVFTLGGALSKHKAERAVALSMEKYCSVTKMLEPGVAISFDTVCPDSAS